MSTTAANINPRTGNYIEVLIVGVDTPDECDARDLGYLITTEGIGDAAAWMAYCTESLVQA
jgi:hypothetical protein